VRSQDGNAFGGKRPNVFEHERDRFPDGNHGDIITRSQKTINRRQPWPLEDGESLALGSSPFYNPLHLIRMDEAVIVICLLLFLALPLYTVLSGDAPLSRDYRTADRSSAGIAPSAATTRDAVVQVYAARALNWRGIFGVHMWIATKPAAAAH
jgi:hypothetical protein